MAVTVYRFGLPAWVDLPPVVYEQLYLAHRLREDLVSLELANDTAKAGVWSSYPGVAAAEVARDAAEAEVTRLAEVVAAERTRQRTRAPKHPAVGELRQAKVRLQEARRARRAAIAAVREDAGQRLADLADDLRAAQKALYGKFCQVGVPRDRCGQCGGQIQPDGDRVCVDGGQHAAALVLHWPVFNDTLAHHRVAAQMIRRKRAQGQPAQLRHHRWDGSGALAVQLQRRQANGDPPRSPQLLASGGGQWRNVLQIIPTPDVQRTYQGVDGETVTQPPHPRNGTLRMRIGGAVVTLPLVMDCDMDPEADLVEARLVVRRVAGGKRCHLTVTAKLPDPPPRVAGATVAVHFGWRREDDDAVRVATWRADQPLPVPETLRDVVVPGTDRTGIVVMPAAWRDRLTFYHSVQGDRDLNLDKMRGELVAWLADNPLADGPTPGDVSRWKAAGRFARLAWEWHHNTPAGAEDITRRLMSWRRWDRGRWEQVTHGTRKSLARRDDAWRRVAAWLTQAAATVVLDDTNLAELTRQIGQADTTVPTDVTAVAARQRHDVAPGYLRDRIKAATARDGVALVTVPAKGLSTECNICGHAGNDNTSHQVTCAGCGRRYDQDASATALMLRRASKGG